MAIRQSIGYDARQLLSKTEVADFSHMMADFCQLNISSSTSF